MTFYFINSRKDISTRKHDYAELEKAMKSPDANIRRNAREAGDKISKESGKIRSMREALIKEHRAGNVQNVKDIHEYIKGKSEYR